MLLQVWGPVQTWGDEDTGPDTTVFPDDKQGAGFGWNRSELEDKRRNQLEQDDQDFLDIIRLSMPEIMKYFD